MKTFKIIFSLLFFLQWAQFANAQVQYGDNKEAGNYISLYGVNHYYEVYGEGPPLLLIHGNSTGIKGYAAQINYFSKKYKVYALDCRGRGKSALGKDTLTYLQMAKDLSLFVQKMQMDSCYIIGRSDGAIVALLMAIENPGTIKKVVAFAPNLWPDTTALYPETVKEIHDTRVNAEQKLAMKDTTQNWSLIRQLNRLMEFQPHITAKELQRIKTPVLLMSCDRDVIKEQHSLFIYQNLQIGSFCILPGETHSVARQNPDLFNATVDRYFSQPYKDRSSRFNR